MLNPYYSFFVGKGASSNTAIDSLNIGDITVAQPVSGALTPPAETATDLAGKDFYILQVIGKTGNKSLYRLSPLLNEKIIRDVNGKIVKASPRQPKLETWTVDFSQVVISKNDCFVLYFVFYNVRDLSPQVFYYPFYFTANPMGTDTATTMAQSFANQINNDQYQKITASLTGTTLTVTAVDPEYVITQRDEFVPLYFEVGFGFLDRDFITGTKPLKTKAVVTETQATDMGIGDWRIVCDQEKRAQARMGIMNWTAFPVTLPRMYTKEAGIYSKLDISFSTPYRAADDTINRLTNESSVIYLETTGSFTANAKTADPKKDGVGAISENTYVPNILKKFCPNVVVGI